MSPRMYDEKGKLLKKVRCDASEDCDAELEVARLRSCNTAVCTVKCSETNQKDLLLTSKGKALLQVLKRKDRHRKILLAGVTNEECIEIAKMLDKKGYQHCLDESRLSSGEKVKKFVENPEMRVIPMTNNLKQGVDDLKVADTVLFWSEYHDDWLQPTKRLQIIKRVDRLGCEHKAVWIVRFRMAPQEDDGPRPTKLRQLRMAYAA